MSPTLHLNLREHWLALKRGRPGHRFQDRYQRARKDPHSGGVAQRFVFLGLGLLLLGVGGVLVVIPGPAIPFLFLAGGLLATESRGIARFMDWSEVKLRKIVAWAKRRWKRLPRWVQIILVCLGACGSAASAYLAFRVMHR